MSVFRCEHTFAGVKYNVTLWQPGHPVLKCTGPICGIDTETLLIENAYESPDLVVAGYSCNGEVHIVPWNYNQEYLIQFLAANPTTKMAFFNCAFDIDVMGRDIWLPELSKDNRVLELRTAYKMHLIDKLGWAPTRVTLYNVALAFLGVYLNKEDGTRTSFRRDMQLTREHILYLAEDCIATELCGKELSGFPTESLQTRAAYVLSEMTKNGLVVDTEYINKRRSEIVEEMEIQMSKLRSFGFKVKRDVDNLSKFQRVTRILTNLGVADAEKLITDSGKKQIPYPAIWMLCAGLLDSVTSGNYLPSDLQKVAADITALLANTDIDWTAKNKALAPVRDNALAVVSEFLEMYEMGDCMESKKPAQDVAIELSDCIVTWVAKASKDINILVDKFRELYDENLGWMDIKPVKPTVFLQNHLKKLMAMNPGLEFPLTEASSEAIEEYIKQCRKDNTDPDPEHLNSLYVYTCTKDDKWRLEDANVTDPFLDLYMSFKHNQKLLSTYLVFKYLDTDGRNHPKFDDFKNTGRTGSSSPNIQNYPKEPGLREQYIPAPGNVFIACDYLTMAA